MDMLPPRYSATEDGSAVTVSRPLSGALWRSLASSEALLLNRAERDAILKEMTAALAFVSSKLEPASNAERTIAIARITSMPSQVVDQDFGEAALHGYRIALDDIPADLLDIAVERCLKDTRRTFRPSPPELRAYVVADLEERKRAKGRLLAIRNQHQAPVAEPEPDGPFDTAGILAEMNRRLDVGYRNMEGRAMPKSPPRSDAVPANVSTALRLPTEAELAEIKAELAARPVADKLTWSDADDAMMRSAAS